MAPHQSMKNKFFFEERIDGLGEEADRSTSVL